MPTVARWLRYPRLVIVASYVAIVLGATGLGIRVGAGTDLTTLEVVTPMATILVGIAILHYAYTRAR